MTCVPISIAIAVVEHADRFLVGVRHTDATLAGFAEFPGGKIEPDEAPEAAAIRECLEETGVVVEIIGTFPIVEHEYRHATVSLHFFFCEPTVTPIEPRVPFRWVLRRDLTGLSFPAANQAVIQYLMGKRAQSALGDSSRLG